ncbi:MAG: hypothetical protein H6Q74_2718 [Firmicutes bacterium]|nr:hypothetical protein [Bacillota bacterium]
MTTTVGATETWFGKNMHETIIISGRDYILLNMGKKEKAAFLGTSKEDARITLKKMCKIDNFPDF